MLRVFIIRIACQKAEHASKLLRPILSWIHDHISDLSSLSDTDAYKVITAKLFAQVTCLWLFRLLYQIIFFSSSLQVYRYLDFLASLLEHPYAKVFTLSGYFFSFLPPDLQFIVLLVPFFLYQALLLGEGFPQILTRVLESCFDATDSDGWQILDYRNSDKNGFTLISWCIPAFKSISLLFSSRTFSQYNGRHDMWVGYLYWHSLSLFEMQIKHDV